MWCSGASGCSGGSIVEVGVGGDVDIGWGRVGLGLLVGLRLLGGAAAR